MLKRSLFFLFFLFSFNALSVEWLYRGDARPPEAIIAAGGFFSRGDLENVAIYFHTDSNNGATAYVSTSSDIPVILDLFAFQGDYVYHIHPANNLYRVGDALGRFYPLPQEHEYVAMNGIPLEQIRGWQRVVSPNVLGPLIENPAYRPDIYSEMTVSPPEAAQRLAGFPANHAAWREEPWMNLDLPGCGNKRKLKSDTCSSHLSSFAREEMKKMKEILNQKNPPINKPLKIKLSNNETTCIGLYDRFVGTMDCAFAPNVRLTKEGLFQFENKEIPQIPLCLEPTEGMMAEKHNWDYLIVKNCDGFKHKQQFKIDVDENNEGSLSLPDLYNYRVSLYNGWLIISVPGYAGDSFKIQNHDIKDYFKGTAPFQDLVYIDLKYNFKSYWWYPKFFHSLATSSRELTYVYYNKSTKKIIDHQGQCIMSNKTNETSNPEDIVEAFASDTVCYYDDPSSRWNFFLSEKEDKKVIIKTEHGKTLMSWHNNNMIHPRFVSSGLKEWEHAISLFTIHPGSKFRLGIYDKNDTLKIFADADYKGESMAIAESMRDLGRFNKIMSSFQIPSGWEVVFYEGKDFTGTYYTRNHSIMFDDTFNDMIQSIKIRDPK